MPPPSVRCCMLTKASYVAAAAFSATECCPQSLISILDMYDIARRDGRPVPAAHESEFQAYHLLTLMMIGGEGGGGRTEFTTHLMVGAAASWSSAFSDDRICLFLQNGNTERQLPKMAIMQFMLKSVTVVSLGRSATACIYII